MTVFLNEIVTSHFIHVRNPKTGAYLRVAVLVEIRRDTSKIGIFQMKFVLLLVRMGAFPSFAGILNSDIHLGDFQNRYIIKSIEGNKTRFINTIN